MKASIKLLPAICKLNIRSFSLIALLFFFGGIASGSAKSLEVEHSRRHGHFVIYFAEADSHLVSTALELLEKRYNELLFDFKIENPDSVYITIVPSRRHFRELLQDRLPDWTGAFASPSTRSMYVKSPRWDPEPSSFQITLIHELFHLFIHDYMGNRHLPRWMDEGMAIFYSRETRWQGASAISKALLTHSLIPLMQIDSVLKFHQPKAELAYQQSYWAVRYLLATYDIDGLRIILDELRRGAGLDHAFFQATGSTFKQFEQEWRRYIRDKHQWTWLQDIDDFAWMFILLLLPLVYVVKRLRARRIQREWEEQEQYVPPNDL